MLQPVFAHSFGMASVLIWSLGQRRVAESSFEVVFIPPLPIAGLPCSWEYLSSILGLASSQSDTRAFEPSLKRPPSRSQAPWSFVP